MNTTTTRPTDEVLEDQAKRRADEERAALEAYAALITADKVASDQERSLACYAAAYPEAAPRKDRELLVRCLAWNEKNEEALAERKEADAEAAAAAAAHEKALKSVERAEQKERDALVRLRTAQGRRDSAGLGAKALEEERRPLVRDLAKKPFLRSALPPAFEPKPASNVLPDRLSILAYDWADKYGYAANLREFTGLTESGTAVAMVRHGVPHDVVLDVIRRRMTQLKAQSAAVETSSFRRADIDADVTELRRAATLIG